MYVKMLQRVRWDTDTGQSFIYHEDGIYTVEDGKGRIMIERGQAVEHFKSPGALQASMDASLVHGEPDDDG